MEFFIAERPAIYRDTGRNYELELVFEPPKGKSVGLDEIYFITTEKEILKLTGRIRRQSGKKPRFKVFRRPDELKRHLPPIFDFSVEGKIADWIRKERKPVLKIGVVGAVGGGIGDCVVGMTALRILKEEMEKEAGRRINFHCYPLTVNAFLLLSREKMAEEMSILPSTTDVLLDLDAILDLSGVFGHPGFRRKHMLDFYLELFGIPSEEIAPERKRNRLHVDENLRAEIAERLRARSEGRPVLLFHREASTALRSIPKKVAKKYVEKLTKYTDFFVVSTTPLSANSKRFWNMGPAEDLEHFIALIAAVDAVLTVDTSVYHIADAFSKPCVVLFTSIPPERRITYYPRQKGFRVVQGIRELDRTEDRKALARVLKGWHRFDFGRVIRAFGEIFPG